MHEHTSSPVATFPSQKTKSDHGISSVHGSRDGSRQQPLIAIRDEGARRHPEDVCLRLVALLGLLLCVKNPARSSSKKVSGVVDSKKLFGKKDVDALFEKTVDALGFKRVSVEAGILFVSILSAKVRMRFSRYAFGDVSAA